MDAFIAVHKKLRMATVLYTALQSIFDYLRIWGEESTLALHYDSAFDRTLTMAWKEQRAIGWDQLLKGRLSSGWGKAQDIYYRENPDTSTKKHFTAQVWMVKTIGSLLDFTLGLWTDRCDILHGATEKEKKQIKHDRVRKQVVQCYAQRAKVSNDFKYLFEEDIDKLCNRSTQYISKWIDTYKLTVRKKQDSNIKKSARRARKGRMSQALGREDGHQSGSRNKYYSDTHARWVRGKSQGGRQSTDSAVSCEDSGIGRERQSQRGEEEIAIRFEGGQIGVPPEQGGVMAEPIGTFPAIDSGHTSVTVGVRANNRCDL